MFLSIAYEKHLAPFIVVLFDILKPYRKQFLRPNCVRTFPLIKPLEFLTTLHRPGIVLLATERKKNES